MQRYNIIIDYVLQTALFHTRDSFILQLEVCTSYLDYWVFCYFLRFCAQGQCFICISLQSPELGVVAQTESFKEPCLIPRVSAGGSLPHSCFLPLRNLSCQIHAPLTLLGLVCCSFINTFSHWLHVCICICVCVIMKNKDDSAKMKVGNYPNFQKMRRKQILQSIDQWVRTDL